jgi:hypothetical protein
MAESALRLLRWRRWALWPAAVGEKVLEAGEIPFIQQIVFLARVRRMVSIGQLGASRPQLSTGAISRFGSGGALRLSGLAVVAGMIFGDKRNQKQFLPRYFRVEARLRLKPRW